MALPTKCPRCGQQLIGAINWCRWCHFVIKKPARGSVNKASEEEEDFYEPPVTVPDISVDYDPEPILYDADGTPLIRKIGF